MSETIGGDEVIARQTLMKAAMFIGTIWRGDSKRALIGKYLLYHAALAICSGRGVLRD